MEIKFKPVINYDGQEMKDSMKTVLVNALNHREQNEKVSVEKSIKIFNASKKIMKATDKVDLDIDTMKTIKDNLPNCYMPVVAGQVLQMLEPNQE